MAIIFGGIASAAMQSSGAWANSADGRIVYVTSYDSEGGDNELHIMDADGANDTRLTDTTNDEYDPKLSPDGTKILFTTYNNDTNTEQLYIMNADGSNATLVSGSIDGDRQSDWSPDGTKILFTSLRTGNREIFIMNADGSNVVQLTSNSPGQGSQQASWSPDGTKIIYRKDQHIHIMNADGTNSAQLATQGDHPDWSPDGTKIVFTHHTGSLGDRISTIQIDGTNQLELTNASEYNGDPSWSPDGTKIVYASNDDHITIMDVDGSNKTQLTQESGNDYSSQPSWGIMAQSDSTDQDGIDPAVEAAAPNNGDANNDGVADATQSNVSSFVNPVTNSYVSVQSNCTSQSNISTSAESTLFKDVGFNYPAGLVAFTLTCGSAGTNASVAVYFYNPPTNVAPRKYNDITHTYQTILGASLENMTIGGLPVLKASYTITDGGSLDQDMIANGTIVDPIGLAQSVAGVPRTGLGGSNSH